MNHRELIAELLTLSDEALKAIKKEGLAKNREVAKEYVLGGEVQIRYHAGAEWFDVDVTPQFNSDYQYRIKPRTININGYAVQEPVRNPVEGVTYYTVRNQGAPHYTVRFYKNIDYCSGLLNNGLLFYSVEGAEAMHQAILSFTKEKS